MKRQRESGAAYRKEQVRRLLAESAQQKSLYYTIFPFKAAVLSHTSFTAITSWRFWESFKCISHT